MRIEEGEEPAVGQNLRTLEKLIAKLDTQYLTI